MKKELDNYFSGDLSDQEKNSLLDKIESQEDYKQEFIRIQNTVTLSKLFSQKGDKEWSGQMMDELDRKIKRRQLYRRIWNMTKYAAIITLLMVNSWLVTNKISEIREEDKYMLVEVPKGQRISMTLTDGTEVWLSPRSRLRVPEKFNKKNRTVELDGEGYFTVAKNEKKPFIVRTDKYDVKVLGTRFNVFAYHESYRFETDLLEGKVEITRHGFPENPVLLTPGEKLFLKNNQLIKSISHFNNDEYLQSGIFNFRNKPFGEILEDLGLWYDIRFEIQESIKGELPVSGKFRQSDEIKNILKALQGVYPFEFKEVNEKLITIY